jgi:hypothetical protein
MGAQDLEQIIVERQGPHRLLSVPFLPVAQVGERDTTEPTTSNRAQLAVLSAR